MPLAVYVYVEVAEGASKPSFGVLFSYYMMLIIDSRVMLWMSM